MYLCPILHLKQTDTQEGCGQRDAYQGLHPPSTQRPATDNLRRRTLRSAASWRIFENIENGKNHSFSQPKGRRGQDHDHHQPGRFPLPRWRRPCLSSTLTLRPTRRADWAWTSRRWTAQSMSASSTTPTSATPSTPRTSRAWTSCRATSTWWERR